MPELGGSLHSPSEELERERWMWHQEEPLTRLHSAWRQVSSTGRIPQSKKSVCVLRCQLVKVSVSKINQAASGKHINNYPQCQQR